MDFGKIITIASKNEKNSTESNIRRYNTILPPARKEPKSHVLSASVKTFLAKREMEERKKEAEASRKKENLLTLRAQNSKSNKKAKIMASRTKDNDFSRIKLTEDELESKKKTDIELQRRMLTDKVERMKARIELEEKEKLLPRKRKRKSKQTEEENAEGSMNEQDGNSDYEREHRDLKTETVQMKKSVKEKERKKPPNMSFLDLLKVASVRQHQPVDIQEEEEEEERPMTQKEKEKYLEEQYRKKRSASLKNNQSRLKSNIESTNVQRQYQSVDIQEEEEEEERPMTQKEKERYLIEQYKKKRSASMMNNQSRLKSNIEGTNVHRQYQPVDIQEEEEEEERPMTQKEKERYLIEQYKMKRSASMMNNQSRLKNNIEGTNVQRQYQPVDIQEEEEEEERPVMQKEKERYLEEQYRKKRSASMMNNQSRLKSDIEDTNVQRPSKQICKDQKHKLQNSSFNTSQVKSQNSFRNEERQSLIRKSEKDKFSSTEKLQKTSNSYKEKKCNLENKRLQQLPPSTYNRQTEERLREPETFQGRKRENTVQYETQLYKNVNLIKRDNSHKNEAQVFKNYKKQEMSDDENEALFSKNVNYKKQNAQHSYNEFLGNENLHLKTQKPNSHLKGNLHKSQMKMSMNNRNEMYDKKPINCNVEKPSSYQHKAFSENDYKKKDLTSHFKIKKSSVSPLQLNSAKNINKSAEVEQKYKRQNSDLLNEHSLKSKSQYLKGKSLIQKELHTSVKNSNINRPQQSQGVLKQDLSKDRNGISKKFSDQCLTNNSSKVIRTINSHDSDKIKHSASSQRIINSNDKIKHTMSNQKGKVISHIEDKTFKNLHNKVPSRSQDNYKYSHEHNGNLSSKSFMTKLSKNDRLIEESNKTHLKVNKCSKQSSVNNSKDVKKPLSSTSVPGKKFSIADDLEYRAELMKRFESPPENKKKSKQSSTNRQFAKYEVSDEDDCEEEEDEEDDEMDDFIDDNPMYEENEDYSKYIRDLFNYDKRKYRDEDSDDDNMETSYADQLKEEIKSTKIGWQEDMEDIQREQEEKKRLLAMKKKKKFR